MFDNIPQELRLLRNWVVWRYETLENGKKTKIPYSAKGYKASILEPKDWATFEEACAVAGQYNGIGFVLQQHLGYTIIDLDNKPEKPCTEDQLKRHKKIFESFNSYTELSVSKTGIHIVVKGIVPAGMHRDNVEVYSDQRYMAFTGNVIRNVPVVNYQPLLDVMFEEMKPAKQFELENVDFHLTDKEVVEMAMNALNADKFNKLCRGEWNDEYESQSEADFALLSIIAFYTPNNDQVRKIFRYSKLGEREKAIRDNKYIDFALRKIRAQQPTALDMERARANADALMRNFENASSTQLGKELGAVQQDQPKSELVIDIPNSVTVNNKPTHTSTPSGFSLPPGLVGELAYYFYSAAVRPVQEIALAAAIAVTAGICGRAYNISGTGLNQYLIVLARTGSGKEGAASGIEKLVAAVRATIPMIDEYMGPAAFASGQALVRHLASKPCFVSVLGEFGLTLQQISAERANSAEKMLKKVLLDIYGKSGCDRILHSSIYSDIEKNTESVRAPNLTILGEATPETFFDGLSVSHVAEGLIPRFSIIEYKGDRPPRNLNPFQPPSKELTQKFADLAVCAITNNNNNSCTHIQIDKDATKLIDDFDAFADSKMTGQNSEIELQLWNRAHLKALKLAGLLSVGINPHAPIVTAETASWAIDFVARDIHSLHSRFERGDIGSGDTKQMADLKHSVEVYFRLDEKKAKSYGVPKELLDARIVPYCYLMRRLAAVASYRNDKYGSTIAIKKNIQSMIDSGMLIQVAQPILTSKYNFSGQAYVIGTNWN